MSRADEIKAEAAAILVRAQAQLALEQAAGRPLPRIDFAGADPHASPFASQAEIDELLRRVSAAPAARPQALTSEGVALGVAVGRLQAATTEMVALIARLRASARRAAP